MAAPDQVSVNEVIKGLSNYAQIGDAYVAKIRRIIFKMICSGLKRLS